MVKNEGGDQFVVKKLSANQDNSKFLLDLNHPHIVQHKEFIKDSDNLYLVLEDCEGGDLAQKIKNKKEGNATFSEHEYPAILTIETVQRILTSSYEPLPETFSEDLRQLVADTLQPNPENRPSVSEILTRPFIISYLREKKLQHEKPMLHFLHVEMVLLVRDILSKFMKPDAIPLDVKGLLKLDLQNRDLHYPDKFLAVGKFSYFALNKARLKKKSWVGEDQHIRAAFSTLAKFLPNAITSEEVGQLDEEVRVYQIYLDLGVEAKGFDNTD
ncbi:hypothetical protein Q8A67_000087 [Cirrhinus molitorella]|uniref:non-specific serine/threonine protein kinase n=1 Tax=Cirrhinus molitorella TaxID=172907 RepID=A0AA88TXE5_9TELE|nr:hypothetical protein Q8A67_000087 [Cirrhinus molitorella]